MTFSPLYLLSSVVASLSSYPGSLHRLRIHYASAGLRIPLEACSQTMAQGIMQPLPGTIDAPNPEVMMDGLPRRELVWQQTPSTATTDDVEDGVKDLSRKECLSVFW